MKYGDFVLSDFAGGAEHTHGRYLIENTWHYQLIYHFLLTLTDFLSVRLQCDPHTHTHTNTEQFVASNTLNMRFFFMHNEQS